MAEMNTCFPLSLLSELQKALELALQSLEGQPCREPLDQYVVLTAGHVHRAFEGYIFLKASGRAEAAKHLVRPVIEGTIRMVAVRKNPDIFTRIAFSESWEDRKFINGNEPGGASSNLKSVEANWESFKQAYSSTYPGRPVIEQKISVAELADSAKMREMYELFYRLYCQVTHCALRASSGWPSSLEGADEQAMAVFWFGCMTCLRDIGAATPNLQPLHNAVDAWLKSLGPKP